MRRLWRRFVGWLVLDGKDDPTLVAWENAADDARLAERRSALQPPRSRRT